MSAKGGYGFGIVGCGMISKFHAKAILEMKGGHLECVFSRDAAKAEKIAQEFHVKAYHNYEEFLRHKGLDIVTIATPSGAHLEPVSQAAAAGKHIVCEKPLEVTLERIDKMIAVCKKNKVSLSGIFPRRFNPASIEFKKAVDEKRLGKITMADAYIKWFRDQSYYDSGAWRGTWKLDGGGALMNQGIHTIDLLYHLAGDLQSVCAFADCVGHKRIEVEDISVAILKFKSGALGVIEGSTACYSPTGHAAEVHLLGSEGSIFMKDNSFSAWQFSKMKASDKKIVKNFCSEEKSGAGAADPGSIDFLGHQKNFENSVHAIREGVPPMVDGEEGRKSVEIILAIYKSALSGGKPVHLPLKKTPIRKKFH